MGSLPGSSKRSESALGNREAFFEFRQHACVPPGRNARLHAMMEVIAQHDLLELLKRTLHRVGLFQVFHTVGVLLDHLSNAADVFIDGAEAPQRVVLQCSHGRAPF